MWLFIISNHVLMGTFWLEILINISDKDYSFVGIDVVHKSTKSWNAGLNKEETHLMCTLYADGTKTGSYSSRSTYDSPNNYDDVKISYSLRRIGC